MIQISISIIDVGFVAIIAQYIDPDEDINELVICYTKLSNYRQ